MRQGAPPRFFPNAMTLPPRSTIAEVTPRAASTRTTSSAANPFATPHVELHAAPPEVDGAVPRAELHLAPVDELPRGRDLLRRGDPGVVGIDAPELDQGADGGIEQSPRKLRELQRAAHDREHILAHRDGPHPCRIVDGIELAPRRMTLMRWSMSRRRAKEASRVDCAGWS